MTARKELQRFHHIFSGDNSKEMWEEISEVDSEDPAVRHENTKEALYSMGCHCQDLENIVRNLEERISELELGK